jgi:hypothetical protein
MASERFSGDGTDDSTRLPTHNLDDSGNRAIAVPW